MMLPSSPPMQQHSTELTQMWLRKPSSCHKPLQRQQQQQGILQGTAQQQQQQ
jgi:hypothetical protein